MRKAAERGLSHVNHSGREGDCIKVHSRGCHAAGICDEIPRAEDPAGLSADSARAGQSIEVRDEDSTPRTTHPVRRAGRTPGPEQRLQRGVELCITGRYRAEHQNPALPDVDPARDRKPDKLRAHQAEADSFTCRHGALVRPDREQNQVLAEAVHDTDAKH
jgi:hypothetical protein